MTFQDGLAKDLVQAHIPDLFGGRIAVDNPVLIVNEENPLLHGSEHGLENESLHFLLTCLIKKITRIRK
jgi:hypothetical protein